MSDYTPTIARIEDMYSWAVAWIAEPPSERPDLAVLQENQRAEFRRALAAHDAEVAAKTWDEGRQPLALDIARPVGEDGTRPSTKNPYRKAAEK